MTSLKCDLIFRDRGKTKKLQVNLNQNSHEIKFNFMAIPRIQFFQQNSVTSTQRNNLNISNCLFKPFQRLLVFISSLRITFKKQVEDL